MQDGCKVHMDLYMALNGSCFMATWTIFKNHLFETIFLKKVAYLSWLVFLVLFE